MPTLDWIGKKAVLNHHRQVPFHLLREDPNLSAGDPTSGNLLVEGDNLLALKALLPYYAGQIKCIYIDPPYNTGNENWIYNDAVNSPEMRTWLGKVVGGEAEDLSRHDKWLCMMYPRLALLREFLREDGVILVSIDDFEAHRLRLLLDEIFSPRNFIAQLIWDKTRKNDAKLSSVGHEYLIVYAKSLQCLKDRKTVWREQKPGARKIFEKWQELTEEHGNLYDVIQERLRAWYRSLPKSRPAKKLSRYKWVDEHGPWRDRDISWPGGGGPRYDVMHPVTRQPWKIPERGWGLPRRKRWSDRSGRASLSSEQIIHSRLSARPTCYPYLMNSPGTSRKMTTKKEATAKQAYWSCLAFSRSRPRFPCACSARSSRVTRHFPTRRTMRSSCVSSVTSRVRMISS